MFIHAANDYSVAPGEALAAEMQRRKKPRVLRIYPAFGANTREGHSIVYLDVPSWERDVFRFLVVCVAQPPRPRGLITPRAAQSLD